MQRTKEPRNTASATLGTTNELRAVTIAAPAVPKEYGTMYWDCHEHRKELKISDSCTIYHPERGQLCYGERHWDCTLFFPIVFDSKEKAQKWIEDGYIGEIQEAWGNLNIGFKKECLINQHEKDEEIQSEYLKQKLGK